MIKIPEKINVPIYKCPYCDAIYMKGHFAELHTSKCVFRRLPENREEKEIIEFTIEVIPKNQGIETKIIPGVAYHTFY